MDNKPSIASSSGISENKVMLSERFFVRNIDFYDLWEDFMVAAVAAIFGIRIFLELTGYPTIGGRALHISHMLWGGLLMGAALLLLLTLISNSSRRLAAVIGGLGFGTFIDEVGKFVTHDNNYFYQPSFAIIYIIFILLYLLIRAMRHRLFTPKEYLINSLELIKEAVVADLDEAEKERALTYLESADGRNAITKYTRELYEKLDTIDPPKPSPMTRTYRWAKQLYKTLVTTKWFTMFVIGFFIFKTVTSFGSAFVLLTTVFKVYDKAAEEFIRLPFSDLAYLFSLNVAGLLVIAGTLSMRVSRLEAYRWYKRSLLVSLFLTYVFLFYRNQLEAIFGFGFNAVLLATLNYLIYLEKSPRSNQKAKVN